MNKPVKVKGFVAVDSCGDKTDAFIEKACQWLEDNKDHPFIECEDHQLAGFLTNEFIEDFKNYMKGKKSWQK